MAYCTTNDLIDRFSEDEIIQLTDRDNLLTVNTTVTGKAIADASAEIDSYLKDYTLPLAVVPDNLIRAACDMARYYLYDDRAPEQVVNRYRDAVKWLGLVANGTVTLGLSNTGQTTAKDGGGVLIASDTPLFGTASFGSW